MSKLIQVTNIKWDCDDEEELKSLPTEVVVALSDMQYEDNEADDGDTLGDLLSDFYGWCHFGFEYADYSGPSRLPDAALEEY